MPESAKKISNLRSVEQDFEQNQDIEPWIRQKNEPAEWYMRFKRYLDMGPKRSLRKALVAEPDTQKAPKGPEKQETKKLSDVSLPGAWKRASKVWRWVERAEAYDLAQTEKRAEQLRTMLTNGAAHASRGYRVLRLDFLARLLKEQIKPGIGLKECLDLTARYQSIMQQIAREMADADEATLQACDAAALEALKQEMAEGKLKK